MRDVHRVVMPCGTSHQSEGFRLQSLCVLIGDHVLVGSRFPRSVVTVRTVRRVLRARRAFPSPVGCSIRCIHSIGSLGSFCSQISGCKEQWEDTRLKKRGDLGNSCESSLWFTLLKALIIIRSGGAALDILSDVTSSCARPALCSVGLLHDEVHVQDACPRPHVQN